MKYVSSRVVCWLQAGEGREEGRKGKITAAVQWDTFPLLASLPLIGSTRALVVASSAQHSRPPLLSLALSGFVMCKNVGQRWPLGRIPTGHPVPPARGSRWDEGKGGQDRSGSSVYMDHTSICFNPLGRRTRPCNIFLVPLGLGVCWKLCGGRWEGCKCGECKESVLGKGREGSYHACALVRTRQPLVPRLGFYFGSNYLLRPVSLVHYVHALDSKWNKTSSRALLLSFIYLMTSALGRWRWKFNGDEKKIMFSHQTMKCVCVCVCVCECVWINNKLLNNN